MDIEIREVQETDYPDLVSLWNDDLGSHTVTAENIYERFERLNTDGNYKTFVALFENKIVGCITMVQTMALEYEVGYLKINGLVVQKSFQQKGLELDFLTMLKIMHQRKDSLTLY